jgi:hypothetical protein
MTDSSTDPIDYATAALRPPPSAFSLKQVYWGAFICCALAFVIATKGQLVIQAVLGALLGARIVSVAERATRRLVWPRWGRAGERVVVLLSSAILGLVLWVLLIPRPGALFVDAFNMDAPTSVKQLAARRWFYGGDSEVHMDFVTDVATIDQIVKSGGLQEAPERTNQFLAGQLTWAEMWFSTIGAQTASRADPAWSAVPPMQQPKLYVRPSSVKSTGPGLLWDEATGRAYVAFGQI